MGFLDRLLRTTPPTFADDWSAFAGSEHMFFSLDAPFAMIRREVEAGLRRQVADTVVGAIRTTGTPRFLTLGKKTDDNKMIVSFFGFVVQAEIEATSSKMTHHLAATISQPPRGGPSVSRS